MYGQRTMVGGNADVADEDYITLSVTIPTSTCTCSGLHDC